MFESSSSSSAWTPQPPPVNGVAYLHHVPPWWMPIPWSGAVLNNTVLFSFINSCWSNHSVSIALSSKQANTRGLNLWARRL